MHADGAGLNDSPERAIGCAFTVPNTPGARFAEKIYENALAIEIRAAWRAEDRQRAGRRARAPGRLIPGADAMHQLSQSDQVTAMPAT